MMNNLFFLSAFLLSGCPGAFAQIPQPLWEFPAGGFCKVAVAAEGNSIAVLNGNSIAVLEAATGRKLHTLYLPFEGRTVSLSASGAYIACVSGDDMLFGKIPEPGKTIEWGDFKTIAGAKRHGRLGSPVAMDNGKVLVSSYNQSVLRVSKNKIEILLEDEEGQIRFEGISPDGRWAFCSALDKKKEEQFIVALSPEKGAVKIAAAGLMRLPKLGVFKNFTPDGRYVALSSKEGRLNLLDPATGQVAFSKNSLERIDCEGVSYSHDYNVRAVEYSAAKNCLLIQEGPLEEIQFPQMIREWWAGELILLDLANPEPRQLTLTDTLSDLERVCFAKNGDIVIGSANRAGKWTVKAWDYNAFAARASAQFQSPPKITMENPSPEISTPNALYDVKACVQLHHNMRNIAVEISVNGIKVNGSSRLKKDGDCNVEINRQVRLLPGITNSVQISASDDIGSATYYQLVKCTAPRALPPKDENVAYARMNLALIHDEDAYNASVYKRFLENEGAAVTLINFADLPGQALGNFDLLLTWREFSYPNSFPEDKMPYHWSQPHLQGKYDAVIQKIEDSGKPLVAVGDMTNIWARPENFEVVINNWLEIKADARLKTKFQLPADGKVVVSEKPSFHFCLAASAAKSDPAYRPLAVAAAAGKPEEANPVARFRGRYGSFGIAAPFSLWTPEAKDLLMAFLSSFCEHCPRVGSPADERDLVIASAGNVATFAPQQTAQKTGISLHEFGTYHALLIAVEDYADPNVGKLDNPVKDATQLQQALTTWYTFDSNNVTLLKNPTKKDVFAAFARLRSTVAANDNLLIFYAGHGYWDADMEKGYWLPADAERDLPANWIANEDVTGYVRAIKSKHTLLITDACFSGGIFKTRDAFTGPRAVEEVYKLTSRKAITSGTLAVVPDRSVFLQYLTKKLEENKDKYLSEEQLFGQFKTAVINNSPGQVPQFGTILNTGDEGGNFIFIRK